MCTNRIDYCGVFARTGMVEKGKRHILFNRQRFCTYDEIVAYRQYFDATYTSMRNTLGKLVARCSFASLDDMTKTIRDAIDEIDLPVAQIDRIEWSSNFLAQYGVIEELWKDINRWNGPYILFCNGLTPMQRIEVFNEVYSKLVGQDCEHRIQCFEDALSKSMIVEPNWFGNKGWLRPRPINEINDGIKLLIKEEAKGQITIHWGLISESIPIEYVIANPTFPWVWQAVGESQYINWKELTANVHLPWNGRLLMNTAYFASVEDLLSCPITRPYMHSSWLMKEKHKGRTLYGVWDWIKHVNSDTFLKIYEYHGAAGVIQRTWRRHKERLRRRKYATEWLGTVLLNNFPKDVQWMIYRYTRPAGVERGLPPKLH